jgi:hypothetical protein
MNAKPRSSSRTTKMPVLAKLVPLPDEDEPPDDDEPLLPPDADEPPDEPELPADPEPPEAALPPVPVEVPSARGESVGHWLE